MIIKGPQFPIQASTSGHLSPLDLVPSFHLVAQLCFGELVIDSSSCINYPRDSVQKVDFRRLGCGKRFVAVVYSVQDDQANLLSTWSLPNSDFAIT